MKTFSQANRLVEWKLPKFLDFGPLCHFSVNFWARSSLFFPKALKSTAQRGFEGLPLGQLERKAGLKRRGGGFQGTLQGVEGPRLRSKGA